MTVKLLSYYTTFTPVFQKKLKDGSVSKTLMQKSEDLRSTPRAQVKMLGGAGCTYNPSTEPTTKISGLAGQPVYSPSLYLLQFFHFIALICLEYVCVCVCFFVCMRTCLLWHACGSDSQRTV